MLADRARNRRGVYPDRQSIFERYRERPVLAPWSEESLWAYINGGFHGRDDGQVELACPPEVEALYYLIETPDDVWERMARLKMPVTLVAAEQSDRFRVENPTTQEFLHTVPGVKLKTIPGGHFVVQEDPRPNRRASPGLRPADRRALSRRTDRYIGCRRRIV